MWWASSIKNWSNTETFGLSVVFNKSELLTFVLDGEK
jgi:hypothetical protein